MRADIRRLERRLDRLEAGSRWPFDGRDDDQARFDWYADSCPCGRAAGDCAAHPRARGNQRPPAGAWRTWLMLMGRGAGKTRAGAEWVRGLAESGRVRRIALVGPTAADVRSVMIEGESGLLTVAPPWDRPRYEPSRRRLTWPNGTIAVAYSADRPDRLRGPEHDAAWVDELAAWRFPAAWDNLMLGLRRGDEPRVCVTTTPRPIRLIRDLLAAPTTAVARGTTYENRAHLSTAFFDRIIGNYEGTRLGRQEIHAEVLDIGEGAWFARFDPARHVSAEAEYDGRFPVHLAIDCGVSRHVGAVFFQVRPGDDGRPRVTVFGDYHAEGRYAEENAQAIGSLADALPNLGRVDTVRLDPAATARTGVGPAAYEAFERAFGARITAVWPSHRVIEGLDRLEVMLDAGGLLIHPRCAHLSAAFRDYLRARRGGEWLDEPASPQNPAEDLMDALRGGVHDRLAGGAEL